MSLLLTSVYTGILLSSLTGSIHCVGMCGGLLVNVAKNKTENTLYHLGRLISYLTLGAIAGFLGEKALASDSIRAAQLGMTIFLGLFFCWMAFKTWKNQSFHLTLIPAPLLLKIQSWSMKSRFMSPAFGVGLCSGLLPCGWLHTFVITALATQSATQGAMLLFFFWLGTIPALIASSIAFRKLSGPLAKYSSRMIATLLLALGIGTLTLKAYPLIHHFEEPDESCPFHP